MIMGHRGCSLAPENTMESFDQAIDSGATWIELDVHLTADKAIVVHHDPNVDRMTNGTGFIEHKSLARIRSLRIDGKYKIPTLEEVIKHTEGKCGLFIEIKAQSVIRPLIRMIRKYKLYHRVKLMCFAHHYVRYIKKLDSKIYTAIAQVCLPVKPYDVIKAAKADGVVFYYITLTSGYKVMRGVLKKLRAQGVEVYCTPVDNYSILVPEEIEKLLKLRITGFVVNRPDLLIAYLSQPKRARKIILREIKNEHKRMKRQEKAENRRVLKEIRKLQRR